VQFCGINAVLYLSPQILMQAEGGDLLPSMGIDKLTSYPLFRNGMIFFFCAPSP